MVARVVRSSREHAELIAMQLRAASRQQVEVMGLDSAATIVAAVERSRHCWSGFWDDDLACILGVESTTMLSDTAYLWIVTTPVVDQHPFVFARWSQKFIRELLEQQYVAIMGCVDPTFPKAVRWLKWLGFKITPMPETPQYQRFEMRRVG